METNILYTLVLVLVLELQHGTRSEEGLISVGAGVTKVKKGMDINVGMGYW